MKLNDEQLEYIRDRWNTSVESMRQLDAYRGWINLGYCETCADYVKGVFLCDDDGSVQHIFTTDGRMPGEDSLPELPDEDEETR